MDKIATTNQQIAEKLQQQQNPLFLPSVLDQVEDDVFETVKASVARCYADLNLKKLDDASQDYLLNQLTDNILEKFPQLRLHEIPIAFANGIRGKYGEYFGLSVVSFEQFLQGYLDSDERLKLAEQKAFISHQLEEKTKPTVEEQFNTSKFVVLDALQRKISLGSVSRLGNVVYSFLNRIKLLDFSSEEKYDFLSDALTESINELTKKLSLELDPFKRVKIQSHLTYLNNAQEKNEPVPAAEYEIVSTKAKQLTVESFFNACVIDEMNVEELIEQRRQFFYDLVEGEGQI